MDKRYKFIVGGKTYFKNVSPNNQQKFFDLYGKYNPVLVPNEPSKSIQETDQSQQDSKTNKQKLWGLFKQTAKLMPGPTGSLISGSPLISDLGVFEIGKAQKEGLENLLSSEDRTANNKRSEGNFLVNDVESTLSEKPLDFKLDSDGTRMYLDPRSNEYKREVKYDYDRSMGIRFDQDSYGKFLDNITYAIGVQAQTAPSGEYTDAMIDLLKKGSKDELSEEEAKRTIEAMKANANKPKSSRTINWIKTMEEEKNPVLGFIKATVSDPIATMEVLTSSIVGQANAITSGELAATAIGVGGATAYAGSALGPLGTATGFMRGFMSTLGGGVETSGKFGELLQEEFGRIPTEEELIDLYNNKEKWNKFRNKSVLKGLTIAAVDNIGGGIVANSTLKTARTGKKMIAAAKGGAGEAVVGGGGEALSSLVIGEKINAADVGLEILGQGGQAVVDIGPALMPGEYTINKGKKNEEKVSFEKLEEILESATPEQVADMNIEVKDNDAMNARVKREEFKGSVMSTIDSRVVDQDVREEMYELLLKKIDAQSKLNKNKKTADDLGLEVDQTLVENLNKINEEITQLEANYTALTDKKVATDIEARSERIADKQFKGNLEFAKKHSTLYGLKYKEMTQGEIRNKYGNDAADNSTGFVDPKTKELVINLELAKKEKDVEVGNHELLHGILRKALKEGKINTNLIQDLKKQVGEQWSAVEERKTESGYTDEYMAANPDEWITLTSDAIRAGEITYSESAFQPLMDVITPILRAFGFKNINFKDGKAVFDFLKEYNRSIHKGALSSGIVSATASDIQTEGDIKTKRVSSKKPVDNLALNPNTNKRYTKEEWDNGGASRAIKEIKKKRNIDGEMKGYLDDLIAAKYKIRPVPDKFVDDVVGSSFFINHINSFNPEVNDSLFGWVNSQIRNKANSVFNENETGKLPKGTKTVEADARTTEGQEVVQLEDTDTSFERIDNEEINLRDQQTHQVKPEVRERKSKFRNEIGITRKGRVFREVKKALRTAASITDPKKFLKTFEKTVSDSLFNFMKNYFPDTTSMIKYREAILESIPVSTLVQMQKQLPEKIFVKNYGRLTNKTQISDFVYGRNESGKNPGKKKLLTEEILNDSQASKDKRKAGVPVYERLKPTSTQWKNYLEATERGKRQTTDKSGTKGNNRIKILEESAKAIGRDATPENLTTDFLEDYIQEKGLEGKLTVDQVREEINKTIDRPSDLKFKRVNKSENKNTSQEMNDVTRLKTSSIASALFALQTKFDLKSKGRLTNKEFKKACKEFFEIAKVVMPEFIDVLKRAGVKSNRTTYGNVGFFNEVVGEYNDLSQVKFDKTIYTSSGSKKLNKNIFRIKNGNLEVNIGQEVRKQKFVSAKQFAKLQKEKTNTLINFFRKAKKLIDQYPKHKWAIVSFILDAQNNVDHLIRISAPIIGVPIDKNGKLDFKTPLIQEHMMPQSDIGKLFLWAVKNNKIEELALVLKSSYAQIALRNDPNNANTDDVKLTQNGLRASMTNDQEAGFYNDIILRVLNGDIKQTDGLLSIVRYAMANVDLNAYMLIESGKSITEHFGIDVKNFNQLNPAQQQEVVNAQNKGLIEHFKGNVTLSKVKSDVEALSRVEYKKSKTEIKNINNAKKAKSKSLLHKRTSKVKGMSTFDFDETLIIDGENFVIATHPMREQVKISSGQWPTEGPKLAAMGYNFNFDDFVNVRGGVDGPLLQKMKNQIEKYGTENVFVLTARPQTADVAIHEWLKSKGINIPFKNITGLAQSEGQAKADWMLEKFAEGYNDMYFVDDALPNVEAVKNVLEQLDIKSKVVQARLKFKRKAPLDLDKILEETKGIDASRKFTASEAMREGARRSRFKFFVPPSAEDFKGLLYAFLGKGRKGDAHMQFFKETLLDPYAKGYREWNSYKQAMSNDYQAIKKKFKSLGKKLKNKVRGTSFDNEAAIRVYLWNKAGFEIPGINEEIQNKLVEQVENNPELKAFAEALSVVTRLEEGYVKPSEFWAVESIASDLTNVVNKVGRKEFLAEWMENKSIIFSIENMNKIEAIYGTDFRDALENILHRMETGTNRVVGKDKTVNKFLDWINGSVGAVMFFNIRSAALQTISTINFINASDNNMFRAAAAFANQVQFWKDFAFIFNSSMLKQRRAGLQIDVSASELTKVFADSGNKSQAVINWLLEKGFKPTQIADSFAISAGGATFYRNRIKKYIKEGMSETKAKEQAFLDFQEMAEETQQSSRPDLISAQQAGVLGRIILAWQNTPMQMTRLTKKSISDLVNRRRIKGLNQFQSDKANISRIMYYGLIQNLIFGALQTGLAFLLFGWDEDEERKKKLELRVANGALDTILRGTGVYGAAVSTLKNTLMKWREESQKGWKRDDLNIALEAISLSPPLGSKLRKIISATRTEKYNKGVSEEIGFRIENPNISIAANWTEALLNIPVARVVNKANNVEEAITGNHDIWQRVALISGWNRWDIGVKDEELEEAKQAVKDKKKKAKEDERKSKEKKKVRCTRIKSNNQRCKNKTDKKNKRCYAHQ